jgi:hypothetical protein
MDRTLSIAVLSKNKFYTEFMQCADMFEKFKVMSNMEPVEMQLTLKPDADPTVCVGQMVTLLQTHPETPAIAVWCHELRLLWKDETVKVVSDGKQWGLFDRLLAMFMPPNYASLNPQPLNPCPPPTQSSPTQSG